VTPGPRAQPTQSARSDLRVTLRRPRPSDRDEFVALVRASRSLHRSWVAPPRDARAYADYLERLESSRHEGFLVCRKSDAAIVGLINLNEIVRGALEQAYLGYWVGAPFARQGYMSEALGLVQREAFRGLRLHRLEADVQPENQPSIALVRGRGFRCEGFKSRAVKVAGRWRDHLVFACLAEDWRGAWRPRRGAPPEIELRWRPRTTPRALERLRASVGFEALGERAERFQHGCFASAAALGPGRDLVAWCGVVSDGAQHAVLVDVMVDRRFQLRGIGRRLVEFTLEQLRAEGLGIVHVDFVPELANFYERCGFRVGLAGIVSFRDE
jgi:ribosomal-protein-alanine N-acetyltransferase